MSEGRSGPRHVAARRTHHWGEWSLDSLLEAKEVAGSQVSLVVPARNEAATVGDVVRRVREALMESVALIDEIVVIDSDSTDDTAAVAAGAGAVVHRSAEIRPDLGSAPGKGEAMWKSLFVTSGDVLVFMDADLLDWDTHFVSGLLGPLLTDPGVALVKGFYERPLSVAAAPDGADEGGRVTEVLARPLLALWFPELAGLVQPLAGEWAVRRDLFAALQVPTGYAVELAALIDTLALRGLDAIAQVDLGRRAHRHQSLRDLGAMATQILVAAQARREGLRGDQSGRLGGLGDQGELEVVLRQFAPGPRGASGHDRRVPVAERPRADSVRPGPPGPRGRPVPLDPSVPTGGLGVER